MKRLDVVNILLMTIIIIELNWPDSNLLVDLFFLTSWICGLCYHSASFI